MLIAISGKINSGKDTVTKTCQILIDSPHFTNEAVLLFLDREIIKSSFENKKFADALKDMVCIMLNCTRPELENKDYKEAPLGKEWDKWKVINHTKPIFSSRYFSFLSEAKEIEKIYKTDFPEEVFSIEKVSMTPRLLLQLLGTECGRQILHPNIWVNALMSKYVPDCKKYDSKLIQSNNPAQSICSNCTCLPNWIISDMRFPNELEAVEKRNGMTIRVERGMTPGLQKIGVGKGSLTFYANAQGMRKVEKAVKAKMGIIEHESEIALDDAILNYIIFNNGTLLDLIQSVREILIKENLIKV